MEHTYWHMQFYEVLEINVVSEHYIINNDQSLFDVYKVLIHINSNVGLYSSDISESVFISSRSCHKTKPLFLL